MVSFKVFSIAVIVAFLVSSVEPKSSDIKCPSSANVKTTGKMGKFIVILNKDSTATDHYKMMTTCWNKTVKSVKPNDPSGKGPKMDSDTLMDFSVGNDIKGYSALFTDSFVENQLAKMTGVALVEKDALVKIQYAIPQNLTRRTVDNNPPPNLDRIDQAKLPLDGKFVFPDSAGKGVNIFVIDTGILTTHNEFDNRATFGGSFCTGCNNKDENGHGTQVASVAAGKTFGVARKANLIAVRVLDAKGQGSNVGVINGMTFALDQHNKNKNKNSVVSMSLGGSFSAAVNKAVQDLTAAGVHVVVAAGNDGADACKSSPSSEPSAVTVGATEDTSDAITDFSNTGKCVKVFAPGRNIEGAGIKNNNDIAVLSGTSQATPHVSGTLALIIAKSGNQSPAAMVKTLNDLSTKGVIKGVGNTGSPKDTNSPDSFLRVPAP